MRKFWEGTVRTRAYLIWEAEGRPDGRALDHWLHAFRGLRLQTHQIDPLSSADSVLTLLGRLDPQRLPSGERMAVATKQIEAVEEWLSADFKTAARS